MTASPTSTNHAAGKTSRVRKTVLAWPEVLRAVQTDEGRLAVLGPYRAAGFTADDFGNSIARARICDLLTAREDQLEGARKRELVEEREACRVVRRKLEQELYP